MGCFSHLLHSQSIHVNSNNCLLGAHKVDVVHAGIHRHRSSGESCTLKSDASSLITPKLLMRTTHCCIPRAWACNHKFQESDGLEEAIHCETLFVSSDAWDEQSQYHVLTQNLLRRVQVL